MIENYQDSRVLSSKEGLPKESYFELTGFRSNIDDGVWEIFSNDYDDEFHFDSKAEEKFLKVLKRTKNTIWARNFYPNSDISFQYINQTIKKSYPDFVLVDKNAVNHIFEVKRFSKSNNLLMSNIDEISYKQKVKALKKAYLYASKITKQIFYIAIYEGENLSIFKYEAGSEVILSSSELIKLLS